MLAYTIFLGAYALYGLLPAVLILANQETYTWATGSYSPLFQETIGYFILGLLGFATSYWIFLSRSVSPDAKRKDRDISDGVLWVLIGAGIALKAAYVVSVGGLDNSILGLSGYTRETNGIEATSFMNQVRALSGVADGAACWLLVQRWKQRRSWSVPLVVLLATVALTYVTVGKRLALILPIVAIVIGYHKFVRPLRLSRAPLIAVVAVLVGMGSLLFRILVPQDVAGNDIDVTAGNYSEGSITRFYFYSLEFSTVEMASVSIAKRENILADFDGAANAAIETNANPLLFVIPRAIFPFKPTEFRDLSYGVSGQLTGTSVDDAKVGYAATVVGNGYILGAGVGVLILCGLCGLYCATCDRRILRDVPSVSSAMLSAIAITFAFQLFRQGTLGWTVIVTLVQQSGFVATVALLTLTAGKRWSNHEKTIGRAAEL